MEEIENKTDNYIVEIRAGKIYPTDEGRELIERFIGKRNCTPFLLGWPEIMTVVEKITALNSDNSKTWFEFEIHRCYCVIYSNNGFKAKNNSDTTLSAVYKSVIQFIKWFNQLPEPPKQ